MLILRDMAMRKAERFSDLTRSIHGITPRALSMRLKELEQSGMIERVDDRKSPRFVRWNLTEKAWDTLPILMSYVAFGSKWFAPTVFEDAKPRQINDIYPQKNLKPMYVKIDVDPMKMRKILRQEASTILKTHGMNEHRHYRRFPGIFEIFCKDTLRSSAG